MKIYPSILAADFLNLESELESIASADGVHIDVMDGHFVPNLTFGLPVVKQICQVTKLPTDVHLMIEDADRWAALYAQTGAHSVTFHLEAASDPVRVIDAIRQAGALAAVAVKPATQIELVEPLLSNLQMVLVMTVEPGFGGQEFMSGMLPKVRWLSEMQKAHQFRGLIQVDGGVNDASIERVAEAGADIAVAGSAVFASMNRKAAIEKLRELAIGAG